MQKQLKKFAALALLASLPADAVTVESSTTFARSWLRAHAAPSGDELAELKGVNPEAYALVKALLTKRSLGLLDPKHPTASFVKASAPPAAEEGGAADGAQAFQLSETDREQLNKKNGGEADDSSTIVSVPYADVSGAAAAPAHHNWLSWKPQDSATDDESMVKSVLGEVASLKAGQSQAQAEPEPDVSAVSARGSALAADEAAFGGKLGVDVAAAAAEESEAKATKAAPPAVAKAAASSPADSSADGNSYLNAVDFGLKTAEPQPKRAAALQGNSYLRGLDLGGSSSRADDSIASSSVSASSSSSDVNYLSSFSWGDAKPQEVKKPQPPPAAPKKKKATGLNVLSSWLTGGSSATESVAPAAAAPAAPAAAASNPYLTNW